MYDKGDKLISLLSNFDLLGQGLERVFRYGLEDESEQQSKRILSTSCWD